MNMYHLMSGGPSPLAGFLVNLIGLDVRQFPRLRDAHLESREGTPVVRVLCRAGGGNRPDYEAEFAELQAHPRFLGDEDCAVDSTYCEMRFAVRKSWHADLLRVLEIVGQPPPFSEAFEAYLARVESPEAGLPWRREVTEEQDDEANALLRGILESLVPPEADDA